MLANTLTSMRQPGGAVVEMLPYSTRGPGLILTAGAVYTEFVHSTCDRMSFLRVLWFSPTLQSHTGL